VIVNSPIVTASLRERTRTDWSGISADGLRNALLADLRTPLRKPPAGYKFPRWYPQGIEDPLTYEESEAVSLRELYAGALRRLRFYFPDTYAALSGPDLRKRLDFERNERDGAVDYFP
jgi:hypothetical protein